MAESGVGADSVNCEEADNSEGREARRMGYVFMGYRNHCPGGRDGIRLCFQTACGTNFLQTVNVAVFLCQIADVSGCIDLGAGDFLNEILRVIFLGEDVTLPTQPV